MAIAVYQIVNKINGKSYVGITNDLERRWAEHTKGDGSLIVYNALRKHGEDNFSFCLIERVENWQNACEKEKYYIKFLNTKTPHGYNLTDGGDGNSEIGGWNKGVSPSEEIRERISDTLKEYFKNNSNPFKGKFHSEESRKKISKSCKKAMTVERREGISRIQKGRKASDETKRKMSAAMVGEKNHHYGKKFSEEHRKRLPDIHKGKGMGKDNSFYGKYHTEETKKLIADIHRGNKYNLGRVFSDEHKRKLSEAKKRNKNRLGGIRYLEKLKQEGGMHHGDFI